MPIALSAALLVIAAAIPAQASDDGRGTNLAIAIGRWPVLIDRALDGLGVSLPSLPGRGDEHEAAAALVWALRSIARDGAILKELACAKKVVGPARCRRFKLPSWVAVEAEALPSIDALAAREQELGALLWPIIRAACAVGVRRTKDPLFCSVE